MRRDHLFICLLLVLFAALLLFGSRAGMYLQRALTGSVSSSDFLANLTTLRATVEGYGTIHTIKGDASLGGKIVPVYSRYPFNLKNEILIAAGESDGIQAGDVAVSDGSILGIVEQTWSDSALVETIFDTRFKAPVRIGQAATDALLTGGPEPKITLIPAGSKVAENDQVYTSGVNLPYGTELGVISGLGSTDNSLFMSAGLKVIYNPAALSEVTIIPKANKQ